MPLSLLLNTRCEPYRAVGGHDEAPGSTRLRQQMHYDRH